MSIKEKKAKLKKGRNGLLDAIRHGSETEILEWIQAGADAKNTVDEHGNTAFILLLEHRSFSNEVLFALIDVSDINASNKEKKSALMVAVIKGWDAIVDVLIKKGANVNAVDANGDTSLHLAASAPYNINEQLITHLLANGADPTIVGSKNLTTFDLLIQNDKSYVRDTVAKCLYSCIVSCNNSEIKNQWVHQAFIWMLKHFYFELATKLIDEIDVKKRIRGWTPLHCIAYYGYEQSEMINKLLIKGSDVNELTLQHSRTPLLLASRPKLRISIPILSLLIANGADVSIVDERTGKTAFDNFMDADNSHRPLSHARNKREEWNLLDAFIFACHDPALQKKWASRVFFLAMQQGNIEFATKIIDLVDPDARNNDGDAPLIIATKMHEIALINKLMIKGSDASVANNDGKSAKDYAKDENTKALLERKFIGKMANDRATHMEFPLLQEELADIASAMVIDAEYYLSLAARIDLTPEQVRCFEEAAHSILKASASIENKTSQNIMQTFGSELLELDEKTDFDGNVKPELLLLSQVQNLLNDHNFIYSSDEKFFSVEIPLAIKRLNSIIKQYVKLQSQDFAVDVGLDTLVAEISEIAGQSFEVFAQGMNYNNNLLTFYNDLQRLCVTNTAGSDSSYVRH